jgi:predicted RND superfamily exporter protein
VLHRDGEAYDSMVISITVSAVAGTDYGPVAEDMIGVAEPMEALEGVTDVSVIVTGSPMVSAEILDSIGRDQLRSVLITVLVSLGILTSLYMVMRRSAMLGLVTITPLLFVIIWGAGCMHFSGIPLNVVTVTILAITVGLGIDYGIHVTQRFLEDLDAIGEVECALCVTADHTGSALFGSVVTTVIGFGILTLSIVPPIAQLGVVTALTIGLAFFASLFVLPTFLRLWYVYGPQRKASRPE